MYAMIGVKLPVTNRLWAIRRPDFGFVFSRASDIVATQPSRRETKRK
jgi:hypothetical protein